MPGQNWGERLRSRAQELGWSDAEVARRIGIPQRRYSTYVNMTREPNFADLMRICAVLGTTPDHVLGGVEPSGDEHITGRAVAALRRMPPQHQKLALVSLEAMASIEIGKNSDATAAKPSKAPERKRLAR